MTSHRIRPGNGDRMYAMVTPEGTLFGATNGPAAADVRFCNACHSATAETQDYFFLLPEDFRVR